jgi:UDPglucose 6-dehydrogenase
MKIAMIGAGYVGLTTGACLAHLGHTVTCIDIDKARIETLEGGRLPIYEPDLEALVMATRALGRLKFSPDIAAGVAGADAVFLAVGTPSRPDGAADLSYIEAAARQVAPAMRRDCVVVIKSTVVAGTARHLREIIAEARGGLDFSVASNPEFLREGSAVSDFLEPDRIVIGTDDRRAARTLREIYAPLCHAGAHCLFTSTVNAETLKYAANALLALKIGFINDIADLCEQIGGDVRAVAEGIGLDRRIGSAFLAAGPGFGGSCFPKDTRALAALGRRNGAPQALVEALIDRNDERKVALGRRILEAVRPALPGARVAVLGVAFKANTDDVREAAALSIVPLLEAAGCIVHAHDPEADAAKLLPKVIWHDDPYAAAERGDAVVILTEWDCYRELDLPRLASVMAGRMLFDFRNLFETPEVEAAGLRHIAIGRAGGAEVRPVRHPGRASASATARIVASPS